MKKTNIILLFLLWILLIFNNQNSYGQNAMSDTITWQANGFNDKISGIFANQQCYFKTYGASGKIDWVQGNDQLTISFDGSLTGRWKDTTKDGSISYSFTYDETNCKIVITRLGGNVTILLDMRKLEDGDILNEYVVNQITAN